MNKYKSIFSLIVSALSLVLAVSCSTEKDRLLKNALKGFEGNYAVYVDKGSFTLTVYDRDIKTIKKYPIAYGLNPDRKPKIHEGDNRTPEGLYHVTEVLSMDASGNTESYRKLAIMNRFYFRASQGHHRYGKPHEDIGDNAYGSRFFRLSYPNDMDMQRYEKFKSSNHHKSGKIPGIGGGIAIHGNNDPESIGHLASSGCVRMYNDHIIELEKYIQVGTPVVIKK